MLAASRGDDGWFLGEALRIVRDQVYQGVPAAAAPLKSL
jgi:hypothetical protein